MPVVIVDRPGARVELASRQILRLLYADGESHRIGLQAATRLVLVGEVDISTGALRACQEAGVALLALGHRGRTRPLHLLPGSHGRLRRRHAQHRLYADPGTRLALARAVVDHKIARQMDWLDAHELPGESLRRFREDLPGAPDIATLMGLEGAASARYFEHWRGLWQPPWDFPRRSRRPPQDPVNALLSLSYTLALGYLGRLAALHGLEPELGFLHGPQRDRPALALDLLEPLRPLLDHWVWGYLQQVGELTPGHFSHGAREGCRLNREGRALFFRAWFGGEDQRLEGPAREGISRLLWRLRRVSITPHP